MTTFPSAYRAPKKNQFYFIARLIRGIILAFAFAYIIFCVVYYEISGDVALQIFISLCCIVLVQICYRYFKKYFNYSNIGYYNHAIIHNMRDYIARIEQALREKQTSPELLTNEFKTTIILCLNNLSELFSSLTNTRCSISIKEIIRDKDSTELKFSVLARDVKSKEKRFEIDKVNEKFTHFLNKSSSFSQIFYATSPTKDNIFLSNNIVKLWKNGEYYNSSMDALGEQPDIVYLPCAKFPWFKIVKNWPLPYKSVMIAPIRYFDLNENKTFGFLCIDAKKKNAFQFFVQVDLICSYADLFYTFFSRYKSIIDSYSE